MKNEMKDEDLAKVNGGYTISKCSKNRTALWGLTPSQMDAMHDLEEQLGASWCFEDYAIELGRDEDYYKSLPVGNCIIKGFNDEIFERIKQVIGEPEEVRL